MTIQNILDNPSTAPVSTYASELLETVTTLAQAATAENLSAIAVYLTRIFEAGKPEYVVICLRDAVRRDASLCHCDAFIRTSNGPIGRFICEQPLTGIL